MSPLVRPTWAELVDVEPCLQAALQIVSHHDREWHAYESFKRLVHDYRIVGWGADTAAVATSDAWTVATTHAANVLVPPSADEVATA